MRSIIVFHRTVRDDLRAYRQEMKANSPLIGIVPLLDFQVRELKRFLAQTAGQPVGAYQLYENIMEVEFVRGRVWVRYCVERESRNQVRITVLGWKRFPFRR